MPLCFATPLPGECTLRGTGMRLLIPVPIEQTRRYSVACTWCYITYSKSSTTMHDMHDHRQQTLRITTTTVRVSCLQLTRVRTRRFVRTCVCMCVRTCVYLRIFVVGGGDEYWLLASAFDDECSRLGFACWRVFVFSCFQFSVFLLRAPIINSLYIGVSVHAVKSNVVHYYSHNNITVK